MSLYGFDTTPSSAATVTWSSVAPTSSPVNEVRPSWSERVRTLTRLPTKRRKCSGFASGRAGPGELTSSEYCSSSSLSSRVTRSQSARSTPFGWSMKRRRRPAPAGSTSSTSTSGSVPDKRSCMSLSDTCIWPKKRRPEGHLQVRLRPQMKVMRPVSIGRSELYDQRHRAVVYELHVHVGAERAALCAECPADRFVELLGPLRARRRGEAGAVPAARVAVDGEV